MYNWGGLTIWFANSHFSLTNQEEIYTHIIISLKYLIQPFPLTHFQPMFHFYTHWKHGMHPPPPFFFEGGGGGGKDFGNVFSGGGGGEGNGILRENLKLLSPRIKSIFRITSLIYFRCIRNTVQYVLSGIQH